MYVYLKQFNKLNTLNNTGSIGSILFKTVSKSNIIKTVPLTSIFQVDETELLEPFYCHTAELVSIISLRDCDKLCVKDL